MSPLAYALHRRRVRKGSRVELLNDGAEAYPAMLEAIASGRELIDAEFYIWRGDQTGWRFADALIEQARRGVIIRVMVDAFGCIDVDPLIFDTMRAEGIEVTVYKPLAPWRPKWGVTGRNHRKVLVVDNRVGFVGGINIADDYASVAEGGHGWRDACVQLEGPIVNDLSRLFNNTWRRHRAAPGILPAPDLPRPPPAGNQMALTLQNSDKGQRLRIRRSFTYAINKARSTIFIANAYFIPDRKILRALYRAVARGVDVRVIVPMNSDVKMVSWASRHLYGRMLKRGVRIFEWARGMLHAKTACIDGLWSTVGSYNLDHISLRLNLEINVVMLDEVFGRNMVDTFEKDLISCVEVTPRRWARRSLWRRLRSWVFYQLRALL